MFYCLDNKFIIYLFIQLIVWVTDDAPVIRAVMGDPRHCLWGIPEATSDPAGGLLKGRGIQAETYRLGWSQASEGPSRQ